MRELLSSSAADKIDPQGVVEVVSQRPFLTVIQLLCVNIKSTDTTCSPGLKVHRENEIKWKRCEEASGTAYRGPFVAARPPVFLHV